MLPYALIILLGLLGSGSLQDQLLYSPRTAQSADVFAVAARSALAPWPTADQNYLALRAEPSCTPRATFLLLHGNAGAAEDRAWYAENLSKRCVRVLLAEYPGYGARPGPLGEDSLARDAAEILRRVRAEFPEPLILAGASLGAGVAAAAWARAPEAADALLLITPWDRLSNVAGHHYPWLPVSLLLRDEYDSVRNLREFQGPLGVVVAAGDQVVPAVYGRTLFSAAQGRKRLWDLADVGHNNWPRALDAAWWDEMLSFLLGSASSV